MLLEALEAAAITLLFVQGSIFKPLRERGPALWQELASCPLCMGFWVGVLGHLAQHWGVAEPSSASALWKLAAAGALSGVIALICKFVLGLLDEAIFLFDQRSWHLQVDRVERRREQQLKRKRLRARQQANAPCSEHKCPRAVCEAYHQLEARAEARKSSP